jgi:two-component system sensor histidine kinase HydH
MNRRIFLQLSGPAAIVGLLLFGASLASVWSIHRLQSNLASIMADNVTSLEAAQDLVINFRSLRFHMLLQLMEPRPFFQELIEEDHELIEHTIQIARASANLDRERELVDLIETRYDEYRKVLDKTQAPMKASDPREYVKWVEEHRVRPLAEPCFDLVALNKSLMKGTARESETVARQTRRAVLLLGIFGPISGIIVGYVVSRAWSRSIARLSVRLQDMHSQLDKDVGDLKVELGRDWAAVDRQLDQVVVRVKEAAEQLQRQQREILRSEQLAAVGQLAASVAHEIRNPLTSIKLLIGAALRPKAPQPLTEQDLNVIYQEVGKLEDAVQTLLDYAKPPQIHQCDADLRPVVTRAVNLVRPRAEQQQVRVSVRLPERETPAWIDPAQMGIVFVNLLMNSLDVLPFGGDIDIDVDASELDTFRVSIADNGPGIAPHVAATMFDPFASTKTTGTGLGLSICQRIVRQHGGSIEYEPRPEGGARFVVTVPRVTVEVADAAIARR